MKFSQGFLQEAPLVFLLETSQANFHKKILVNLLRSPSGIPPWIPLGFAPGSCSGSPPVSPSEIIPGSHSGDFLKPLRECTRKLLRCPSMKPLKNSPMELFRDCFRIFLRDSSVSPLGVTPGSSSGNSTWSTFMISPRR